MASLKWMTPWFRGILKKHIGCIVHWALYVVNSSLEALPWFDRHLCSIYRILYLLYLRQPYVPRKKTTFKILISFREFSTVSFNAKFYRYTHICRRFVREMILAQNRGERIVFWWPNTNTNIIPLIKNGNLLTLRWTWWPTWRLTQWPTWCRHRHQHGNPIWWES